MTATPDPAAEASTETSAEPSTPDLDDPSSVHAVPDTTPHTDTGTSRDATTGPSQGTADPAAEEGSRREGARSSSSRAGRDLPAAIGVGAGLGILVILTLVFRRELFLVVLVPAIAVGAWEMARALTGVGIRVPMAPLLIGAVSMMVGAYFRGPEILVVLLALTCLAMLVWRLADGPQGAARDLSGAFFVTFYPCFLGGFCALMLAEPDGNRRVFFFILVTVFSDIGGYAAGVLLGKHPMAPSLSPKKSWEGFAGSVLVCALVGGISLPLLLDGTWWVGALIGVVAAGTATVGDLIESSIKRDLKIKDMGSILPGHGGIMDRLDSLIMTLPVVWALLWWLVPTA